MSVSGGPEQTTADPELDQIEGFRFLSFATLDQVDNYVKKSRIGQCKRSNAGNLKQDAGKSSSSRDGVVTGQKSASPGKKMVAKQAKKKRSLLWKHKKRLRTTDKRVIVDKLEEYFFVSAFTLDDFDTFEEEMNMKTGKTTRITKPTKRKSNNPKLTPPIAPKRTKKKDSHDMSRKIVETSNRGDLGLNRISTSKSNGKVSSKEPSMQKPPMDARKGKKLYPLSKSGLDRLKKLNLAVMNSGEGKICSYKAIPIASVAESSSVKNDAHEKKWTITTPQQFPHVQIDSPKRGPISISSSDSGESTIIISDAEDNGYLDVCSIDDGYTSAQFIRNNMKELDMKETKPKTLQDCKGKSKKKKCKLCCAHPCKIVEAKKAFQLWGSCFPSYKVWCVTTCRLHPPGEVTEFPNFTKEGFTDMCIQTTASDIKMHLEFAQRFRHRVISVTTCGLRSVSQVPKVLNPTVRMPSRPPSKSEHHRTSERKRREQMHGSYAELHKVLNMSQMGELDRLRPSKQWILEQAKKVIGSLEAESIFLTTLKTTLESRNTKLRSKWEALSGKHFDPKKEMPSLESSNKAKLMNLYKKYRQNVQKKSLEETGSNSTDVPGAPEKPLDELRLPEELKEKEKASQDKLKDPIPSLCTLVNKLGHLNNTGQKSTESIATTQPSDPSQEMSKRKSPETVANRSSEGVFIGKAWEPSVQNSTDGDVDMVKSSPYTASTNSSQMTAVTESNKDGSIATGSQCLPEVLPFTAPAEQKWNLIKILGQPSQVIPMSKQVQRRPQNMSIQVVSTNIPGETIITSAPSKVPIPSPRPTIKLPHQPFSTNQGVPNIPKMLHHATTLKNPCQLLNIPKPAGKEMNLKIPRTPVAVQVVGQIIGINNQKLGNPMNVPGQTRSPNQPSNFAVLKSPNQPVAASKPTQWTIVGNITSPPTPIQDVGAVVEVGATETIGNDNNGCNDKITLLDVSETEDKKGTSSSPEQSRTVSPIPTSSSINVTLNSLGSITSNKIYNEKPVPSKSSASSPAEQKLLLKKNSPESGSSIEKGIAKTSITPPKILTGHKVPEISDKLLSETIQSGDQNAVNSSEEPGLCVISNVFSLSDDKPGESLKHQQLGLSGAGIVGSIHNQVKGSLNVLVDMPRNTAIHDHDYTRYKLFLPKSS